MGKAETWLKCPPPIQLRIIIFPQCDSVFMIYYPMLPYNIDEKFGGYEQDPRYELQECGSRKQSPEKKTRAIFP